MKPSLRRTKPEDRGSKVRAEMLEAIDLLEEQFTRKQSVCALGLAKILAVADDPDEWGREIPANLTEDMLEKQ